MARWGSSGISRGSAARQLVVLATVVGVLGAGAVAAFAVSDGNYAPANQHCSNGANSTDNEDTAEEGCHSATATLSDGAGHEYAGAGTDQTADGESVHRATTWADPQGGDPGSGARVYFGADDNLNNGEHDGSSQIDNGPSDGGGIQANVDPAAIQAWIEAVQADPNWIFTHPLPGADAGVGACADGVCFTVQSQRRVVFTGDDPCERSDLQENHESRKQCRKRTADAPDRQVTNYDGHEWDPATCAGPDDTPEDCGGQQLEAWNEQEREVYADPGVSVYEDPDAQGSPIGPYPLPAAYVGPCGLVAGGGPVQAPPSPATNSAGQVVVANSRC